MMKILGFMLMSACTVGYLPSYPQVYSCETRIQCDYMESVNRFDACVSEDNLPVYTTSWEDKCYSVYNTCAYRWCSMTCVSTDRLCQ